MNKLVTFLRESIAARFFIPVGIFLVAFGIFMFIVNYRNKNYVKIDAIVSKTELVQKSYVDDDGNTVDATYKVYVKYTVNGNEYNEELGELSGYKKNQKITIYYDPQNPNKITQTKSMLFPVAFIVAGIVSLIVGIISVINTIKRYKKMKEQERGWTNE